MGLLESAKRGLNKAADFAGVAAKAGWNVAKAGLNNAAHGRFDKNAAAVANVLFNEGRSTSDNVLDNLKSVAVAPINNFRRGWQGLTGEPVEMAGEDYGHFHARKRAFKNMQNGRYLDPNAKISEQERERAADAAYEYGGLNRVADSLNLVPFGVLGKGVSLLTKGAGAGAKNAGRVAKAVNAAEAVTDYGSSAGTIANQLGDLQGHYTNAKKASKQAEEQKRNNKVYDFSVFN